MKWKETEIFFDKLTDLLKYMIPGYKKKEVTACYCYRMYRRSTPISCFSKTFDGEYLDEVLITMSMCITEMLILKVERKMKQMKVVLIGGGTGLSVLARGLREFL